MYTNGVHGWKINFITSKLWYRNKSVRLSSICKLRAISSSSTAYCTKRTKTSGDPGIRLSHALIAWIIYSFTKNVLFATITIGCSHTYGHHQVHGSISIIKPHARAVTYDKVRETRTCARADKSLETMRIRAGRNKKRKTILKLLLRRVAAINFNWRPEKKRARSALFLEQLGMALPGEWWCIRISAAT